MGMLINDRTGQRVVLRANHVFGRQIERCDTQMQDNEVSRVHAIVRWCVGRWLVSDYSRNGSLIDGERLDRGQCMMLSMGQTLRFGSGVDSTWRVCDLGPPVNSLVPLDPSLAPVLLARHNLLPTESEPQICLFEVEPGHWQVEEDCQSRAIADGDSVVLNGQVYRLQLTGEADDTYPSSYGEERVSPLLLFQSSLDEEHTRLQVRYAEETADLGERSHHYCLMTLARQRLADARAGFDSETQGWIDSQKMASKLGIDLTHLNILIYRARGQLTEALPTVATMVRLVERRRGELRLGNNFSFEIRRGSQLEGSYHSNMGQANHE